MHKIFAYGTLSEKDILESIIGRVPEMADDKLLGYFLSKHGEYPNIVEEKYSMVAGKVFEVEQDELKKIDAYEGFDYSRVGRKLKSGLIANVYIAFSLCNQPKA